jgi:WD40 repeat protein
LNQSSNNRGKLVTREELQQKLWPGATYGDFEHGLNAAVNRLRETLGDSATDPKYIETIPRRGYRFVADLESPGVTSQPKRSREEQELPKPRWWKRKATIAAAACIVIAGSLYPWIRPKIERLLRLYELQQVKVVPLTALPGNAWSPTFSPDGSQVAFVWDAGNPAGADLYVKVIGSDKPLRLTHDGFATRAAWSPDGRSIALWRNGNTPADCGLSLITPLGGPERRIASASCFIAISPSISWSSWSPGSSWSPDGKQLAFLDHPRNSPSAFSAGLYVLSLDSMEKARVKTDCDAVLAPHFHQAVTI